MTGSSSPLPPVWYPVIELNRVKNEVRRDFFERNPEIAKAWAIDIKHKEL